MGNLSGLIWLIFQYYVIAMKNNNLKIFKNLISKANDEGFCQTENHFSF
jgi:hypothetical protein